MRILLVDSNHDILHETLRAAGFECDCFWDRPADELQKILPAYDGLVIRSRFRLSAEVLERCPNLKVIGRVGAGMENIDLSFAKRKGIRCVAAPEGNRDAVGEHAIGMLLMLLNHLGRADNEVRKGIWRRAENRGTEISGKTVGIIGYGHMGSSLAKKLSGFDCRILVHDKYRRDFGHAYIEECDLATLQQQSDIISLHLPLTDETRFYCDGNFFQNCSKPFYLVNTSRGPCVNTEHLVEAIKSEKVLGACLDVLEYEKISFEAIDAKDLPPAYTYLVNSDKVILSPHIAGWTHESNYKMSRIVAEKMIKAFSELKGKG